MKALLLSLLAFTSTVAAEPPPPPSAPAAPKPPVGVPVDAKFFNGKWYRVYFEKLNWHAARDKCKMLGGQLVTVPDAKTWGFVKGLAGGTVIWLGATDEKTNGVWEWVNGDKMEFAAWYSGEPNNTGGVEHYLATLQGTQPFGGAWNDVPEKGEKARVVVGFIAEWKGTSTAPSHH